MTRRHRQKVAKDYRPWVKLAQRSGWRLVPKGRAAHPKLVSPSGRFEVPVPGSNGHGQLLAPWSRRLVRLIQLETATEGEPTP